MVILPSGKLSFLFNILPFKLKVVQNIQKRKKRSDDKRSLVFRFVHVKDNQRVAVHFADVNTNTIFILVIKDIESGPHVLLNPHLHVLSI